VRLAASPAKEPGDLHPFISINALKNNVLSCTFEIDSNAPGVPITYSPARSPFWEQAGGPDLSLTVEFRNGQRFNGDLPSFLGASPPILIMPQGGIVINADRWLPADRPGDIPGSVLKELKWSGCDIRVEEGRPARGMRNVQDWILAKLQTGTSTDTIIIKDHRKGELADFIVLEPGKKRSVTFYHVKASTGNSPADRVKDVEEVLSQACRSAQWMSRQSLMDDIVRQTRGTRRSPILKGTATALANAAKKFKVNAWTYKIVAVQPGLKCSVAQRSTKTGYLVATTYEVVSQANSIFECWGA